MAARYDGGEFRDRFGAWVVVAGGSDGIGAAFARDAAARGLNVAVIARRGAPLEALAKELQTDHGIEARAIRADLTSPDIATRIADATDDLDVGLFVYNAGSNPSAGRFLDQPAEDAQFLVDLSCRAPAALCHHFGGRLRERGRGGIVLMSSMASLAGGALHATYAATKAFLTILAEGLWVELAPTGVDVLGVLAGATRTETVMSQNADAFESAMDPAEVAQGALDHLGKGPNFVPGDGNRSAAKAIWPTPRVVLVNGMSQAAAELFDETHTAVPGVEFDED
jgi:short-subunit dehydrogenase